MGEIGDEASAEPLVAALRDSYSDVRREAAAALEKIGFQETLLRAVVVILNKDLTTKKAFVNSILSKLIARGRPYREWMTESTPVEIHVNPSAQDPMTFAATALVTFGRLLGEESTLERLEHATFQSGDGISGVILSYWAR